MKRIKGAATPNDYSSEQKLSLLTKVVLERNKVASSDSARRKRHKKVTFALKNQIILFEKNKHCGIKNKIIQQVGKYIPLHSQLDSSQK